MHKLLMKVGRGLFMRKSLLVLWLFVGVATTGCQDRHVASAPLIGITSVYKADEDTGKEQTVVNFAYIRAVTESGGVPVILPTVDD